MKRNKTMIIVGLVLLVLGLIPSLLSPKGNNFLAFLSEYANYFITIGAINLGIGLFWHFKGRK